MEEPLLLAPSYFFRVLVMALANCVLSQAFSLFFRLLMVASLALRGITNGDAGMVGRDDGDAEDGGAGRWSDAAGVDEEEDDGVEEEG